MLLRPRTTLTMALAVLVALVVGPTVAPSAAHAAPPRYKCMILPGTYTANGVNKLGEVVGRTAPYNDPANQAFYYKAGRLTPFGQAGGRIEAFAISDAGHIAGVHDVGGAGRAMMADRAGTVTTLEDRGFLWSEAYAINDAIQAVGFVEGAGEDRFDGAAMWDAGAFRDLAGGSWFSMAWGINNLGEIVGHGNGFRAVYFNPSPSDMGAPGETSWAESISDAGYVAGTAFDRESSSAWVYDGSGFQIIATGPPDDSTRAHDVNNLRQVVGQANGEAFLWDEGIYSPLASLIDDGACTLVEARSINDCGVIVGRAAEGAFMMVPIDKEDVTDTDGDGLKDRWERCGLDLDGDGVAEFVPPDADPQHADLYVELDHVAAAPVRPEVQGALVQAFAQVPGADLPKPGNPDGQPGITLHLLVDDANVTDPGDLPLDATGAVNFPGTFDLMKEYFFGTAAERNDPDSKKILAAKRQVYHYGIMGQGLTTTRADGSLDYTTGIAECLGNDFMIGTKAFRFPPGSWQEQAGTLMHELGHNLGLKHGGGDDMNFKANYFSVMNYTWQIPYPGMFLDWRLDYSRSDANPSVFETILNEERGLEGITRDGESVFVYIARDGRPEKKALAPTNTPDVDFSGNNTIDRGQLVSVDLNHVDADIAESPEGRHTDYDDWANLVLDFRAAPSFPEGVHALCLGSGAMELSSALIQRLAEVAPDDPASVAVLAPAGQTTPPAGVEAGAHPIDDLARVRFTLPEAGPVRVRVFDMSGRLVRTLFDGIRGAGPGAVDWDGRDDRGETVGPGLYFAQIEDAQERRTTRVIVRR